MAAPYAKVNPLSRNPELRFKDVRVKRVAADSEEKITWTNGTETNVARCVGTVTAMATLPGWLDTLMYYRIFSVSHNEKERILLGSRCNGLSTPQLNARKSGEGAAKGESLWCYTCWSDCEKGDGSGGVNVPFYLYYRHYDDHVLMHLPACRVCGSRFQIWDGDEPLKPGHAYVFSAIEHEGLLNEVMAQFEG